MTFLPPANLPAPPGLPLVPNNRVSVVHKGRLFTDPRYEQALVMSRDAADEDAVRTLMSDPIPAADLRPVSAAGRSRDLKASARRTLHPTTCALARASHWMRLAHFDPSHGVAMNRLGRLHLCPKDLSVSLRIREASAGVDIARNSEQRQFALVSHYRCSERLTDDLMQQI